MGVDSEAVVLEAHHLVAEVGLLEEVVRQEEHPEVQLHVVLHQGVQQEELRHQHLLQLMTTALRFMDLNHTIHSTTPHMMIIPGELKRHIMTTMHPHKLLTTHILVLDTMVMMAMHKPLPPRLLPQVHVVLLDLRELIPTPDRLQVVISLCSKVLS